MIKNEKYEKNLDKICIYMANMSNKEDAVQQVLEKVFTKEFSPAVIQHQKFNILLRNIPEKYFEAYLFRAVDAMTKLQYFIRQQEEKGQMVAVQ